MESGCSWRMRQFAQIRGKKKEIPIGHKKTKLLQQRVEVETSRPVFQPGFFFLSNYLPDFQVTDVTTNGSVLTLLTRSCELQPQKLVSDGY